jgi:hypothetical protein
MPGRGGAGGWTGVVKSGAALSRQRPRSYRNRRARPSWCVSRGGGKGGPGRMGDDRRTCGLVQRNSSFFDLIKVISNGINLIQIKDRLPKI